MEVVSPGANFISAQFTALRSPLPPRVISISGLTVVTQEGKLGHGAAPDGFVTAETKFTSALKELPETVNIDTALSSSSAAAHFVE